MNITRLNTLNDDKVIIKKEGGSGSGSTMEEIYLDASALQDPELGIDAIVTTFKRILNNGNIVFLPYGLADNPFASGENIACMIYANAPISNPATGEYSTLGESLLSIEASGNILPRITKEEFYHIPKIVNIDSMSSDEIKVVFEDLYSQLSLKYNIGDTFDDELSLYGYKEIILGGNSLTKVGQIYSFSEDGILIRLGSEEIPYSQGWGLIRSKVDGDIFYNPHFPG